MLAPKLCVWRELIGILREDPGKWALHSTWLTSMSKTNVFVRLPGMPSWFSISFHLFSPDQIWLGSWSQWKRYGTRGEDARCRQLFLRKGHLGRHRRRWKDNIKMDLKEMDWTLLSAFWFNSSRMTFRRAALFSQSTSRLDWTDRSHNCQESLINLAGPGTCIWKQQDTRKHL
jgi:hypothetical protein